MSFDVVHTEKRIAQSAGVSGPRNAEDYDPEKELNAQRYALIVQQSKVPIISLLHAAIKEDTSFLLPLMLLATIRTMRRIPRTFFIRNGPEYERYVFKTIHWWARRICRIGRIRLQVSGAEKIRPDRAYLFVSNHRSPADIPVLFDAIPQNAAFVANGMFRMIPAFSFWMRASGTVFIEQGNQKAELAAFKTMIRRLKQGRSLILFPEGHTHQGPGIDTFSRGGIYAAVLAGVPIVPVCLSGTDKVIRPGSLHINRRSRVIIEFGAPIETKSLASREKKNIDVIVHDAIAGMLENRQAHSGSHSWRA